MKSITIQPQTGTDLTRPYPFHILPDGKVDRQDFWNGTPKALLGFQNASDVQKVDVHVTDFLTDPDVAVGKYPVFVDEDGTFWNHTTPITEVMVNN